MQADVDQVPLVGVEALVAGQSLIDWSLVGGIFQRAEWHMNNVDQYLRTQNSN